jgi:hypothetical protein
MYAKKVRKELFPGTEVLLFGYLSLAALKLFRVVTVVDAVHPTSNLSLRRVQSGQTPLEHLSEYHYDSMEPFFELFVPLYSVSLIYSRSQSVTPALEKMRRRLLGNGKDIEWPILESRWPLGMDFEPRTGFI